MATHRSKTASDPLLKRTKGGPIVVSVRFLSCSGYFLSTSLIISIPLCLQTSTSFLYCESVSVEAYRWRFDSSFSDPSVPMKYFSDDCQRGDIDPYLW